MEDRLIMVDPGAGTFAEVPVDSAQLPVLDLSAHRGEGIFETLLITLDEDGRPQAHARQPHLTRFAASAAALSLPEPDADLWNRALDACAEAVLPTLTPADGGEFSVRIALTPGVAGELRGWAVSVPITDTIRRQRREPIAVVTLDKGYDAYVGEKAPWLLHGAKTLSYAVNQAAARVAAAQNAGDALFLSHDGLALEGPTANLIIRSGDRLLTPEPRAGLLHGTTQRTVFAAAAELGLGAEYADIPLAEVLAADGAWLVSSARTAVAIRAVDGHELPVDEELTARFQEIIRTRP